MGSKYTCKFSIILGVKIPWWPVLHLFRGGIIAQCVGQLSLILRVSGSAPSPGRLHVDMFHGQDTNTLFFRTIAARPPNFNYYYFCSLYCWVTSWVSFWQCPASTWLAAQKLSSPRPLLQLPGLHIAAFSFWLPHIWLPPIGLLAPRWRLAEKIWTKEQGLATGWLLRFQVVSCTCIHWAWVHWAWGEEEVTRVFTRPPTSDRGFLALSVRVTKTLNSNSLLMGHATNVSQTQR